jgi:Zn-dependent peptidase ImmA (M78 family)
MISFKKDEIAQFANKKRVELGIGFGGIDNIEGLLESQGIFVVSFPLESNNISGAFYYNKLTDESRILVNSNRSRGHQYFTAAHEYCHYLLDKEDNPIIIEDETNQNNIEKRANHFAANFLMPKQGVEEYLTKVLRIQTNKLSDIDLIKVKYEFKTSWKSTIYQLDNLGFKLDSGKDRLLEHIGHLNSLAIQIGFEPESSTTSGIISLPQKYWMLAFQAYFKDRITLEKLAELLYMDIKTTKEMVNRIERFKQQPKAQYTSD